MTVARSRANMKMDMETLRENCELSGEINFGISDFTCFSFLINDNKSLIRRWVLIKF